MVGKQLAPRIHSSETDLANCLLPALRQLDALLERAIATVHPVNRSEPGAENLLSGLCLEPADIKRLLAHPPSRPLFCEAKNQTSPDTAPECPPLSQLKEVFGLSIFDLWLLLIALAPELDLRYERLYGFLQDDITRRRPSVDLALNLLCRSAEEKVAFRAHFAPEAPLIRHQLLRVSADPNDVQPPLLSLGLTVDKGIVAWLLGGAALDFRLSTFCRLSDPVFDLKSLLLAPDEKQALTNLVHRVDTSGPRQLYFWGPAGSGKRTAAEALAKRMKVRLLVADLGWCALPDAEFVQIPGLLCRDALLHHALLFIRGVDTLQSGERLLHYQQLMDALSSHQGTVVLAGTSSWNPPRRDAPDPLAVSFATPNFSLRRAAWRLALDAAGVQCAETDVTDLASRFRFTPGQIMATTNEACNRGRWIAGSCSGSAFGSCVEPRTTVGDLFSAARAQSGSELLKLTRKIPPRYTWKDIVLPADQLDQLKEICAQAKFRHVVYGDWGFDRKLSMGKALNVLFAGPPGTGKTMAAEVIAKDLELDLYQIDLSRVVSKYIGETEKNLDRIFAAADNSNAILFFDEADALFGKRSEVKDAHDRYANIEIGYLLQKMEEYEGIAILATNLRQNLDDAFVRRIQNVVEFRFPDADQRQRIWEITFPLETPLGEDVDFGALARSVKLAGGNIKNIAIAAAFYAAADGRVVRMPHIIRACSREFSKLGQTWSGGELAARAGSPSHGEERTQRNGGSIVGF